MSDLRRDEKDFLPDVIHAARQAGEILLTHFHNGFTHKIILKSDQTPVTQADLAANDIIVRLLKLIDPSIPILSEESDVPDFAIRQSWKKYWLIDPLDGTRGFIRRSPEFCVNIALIENQRPILGVIYSPVEKITYFASQNIGAFKSDHSDHQTPIKITPSSNRLRVVTGLFDHEPPFKKSHRDFFDGIDLKQMNSALKFPWIAQGLGDVYVRFGPTSEWDTAAGQCILEQAGGLVVDFQGQPLHYNTQSSLINPPFLAIGDTKPMTKMIEWINRL